MPSFKNKMGELIEDDDCETILQEIPELIETVEAKNLFDELFLTEFLEINEISNIRILRLKAIFVTEFIFDWLNTQNREKRDMIHQYTFVGHFPEKTIPTTLRYIESFPDGKKRIWNHMLKTQNPIELIDLWYCMIYRATKSKYNFYVDDIIKKISVAERKERSRVDEGICFETDFEFFQHLKTTSIKFVNDTNNMIDNMEDNSASESELYDIEEIVYIEQAVSSGDDEDGVL